MSRLLDTSRLIPVLDAITRERQRQENIGEEKRAKGIDWRSCADPSMAGGDDRRYTVLGEEFGEVGRAILERQYREDRAAGAGARLDPAVEDRPLREELVQVAAVAVAWVEAIDRRRDR